VRLIEDDAGSASAFLMFGAIVVLGALVWILFNEVVLHVGDWVNTSALYSNGGVWSVLVTMLRLTPVVILIASLVWAIVRTHEGGRVL